MNRNPAKPRRPNPRSRHPRQGPRWGWLEGLVIAQTLLPALLFIPGVSKVRAANRIMAYGLGLIAWGVIRARPTAASRLDRFPARPWLAGCALWLVVLIAHPGSYSILAASAQVLLYLAVMSPAFWAGRVVESPRQVARVLAVLFVCNALSSAVGLAQVYRPDTFNPPVIPALSDKFGGEQLKFTTADGRKILRPCGLTDTPGAAAQAGMIAALVGLSLALRPIRWWRRLACAGLGCVGVAVIYYSQVRFTMVMLGIGFASLLVLFLWRGRLGAAAGLVGGAGVMLASAFAWVARNAGWKAFEKFGSLLSGDPASLYQKSRGFYVTETFERYIWEYPLGLGMGWWGMVHVAFGDPGRLSPVWVEVMIPGWVIDGGIPLLVMYSVAVIVALFDTARVALKCSNDHLSFWASVVFAHNLSVAATCFSYLPFISTIGLQFWLLAAAVHAADRRVREVHAPRPSRPQARVV